MAFMFQIKNSSKQPILTFVNVSVSIGDLHRKKKLVLCFDQFLIWDVYQPNESVYWYVFYAFFISAMFFFFYKTFVMFWKTVHI